MEVKYLHIVSILLPVLEPLVDDIFIFRFNISSLTAFKDTCLKLKSFASIFGNTLESF